MDNPRPFGLVHGRIYLGVGDSNDAGRAPDLLGLNGTATFTGTIERDLVNTPVAEMIVIPAPIPAPVVNGAVQWGGLDDVPLVANLDAAGKSLGWQWLVEFDLRDANNNKVKLTGWRLDVKIYDASATFVNGENPTITQLVSQAPVVGPNVQQLSKGDPGPAPTLVTRNVTTTTDPAAATVTFVPSGTAGTYWVDYVLLVGAGGGGGGGGTVTKVAGKSPDGTGNVALNPGDISAATAGDVTTAQTTAGNALTRADAAQVSADEANAAAAAALSGLTGKADASALAGLAPLASPTFTGDPKAPTPATTDNDTSLATTAFVRAAIAAFGGASGGANQVYWNATTHAWTQNGVTITARPTVTGPVVLWSTNDAAATRPSWMAIGDSWIQHPDAVA